MDTGDSWKIRYPKNLALYRAFRPTCSSAKSSLQAKTPFKNVTIGGTSGHARNAPAHGEVGVQQLLFSSPLHTAMQMIAVVGTDWMIEAPASVRCCCRCCLGLSERLRLVGLPRFR